MEREEALSRVEGYLTDSFPPEEFDEVEEIMATLEQEPKTGHWIDTGSGQECSECGEIQYGYDNFRFYCAKCGSKNVIESEVEE